MIDLAVEDVEIGLVVHRERVLGGVKLIARVAHFSNGDDFSFELGDGEAGLGECENRFADLVGDFVEAECEKEVGHLCGPAR